VHWRIYPVIYALPVLLSLQPPLPPPPLPAGLGVRSTAAGRRTDSRGAGATTESLQKADIGQTRVAQAGLADGTAGRQGDKGDCGNKGGSSGNGDSVGGRSATAAALVRSLFSRQRLAFAGAAAATFLSLAALLHRLYGWQFIQVSPV
jgi:hypothetical protein